MYLIAGLGNPGGEYSQTRHNIGFIFLDYLAAQHDLSFSESKWQSKVCRARLWGEQIVFVKPQTFMNLSGAAVGPIATYYKIPSEKIIIIHDDLDLPTGRIKMVCNRGAGGHNGITSIISHLGSKDFVRIRLGVGRPALQDILVRNFVLGNLSHSESDLISGRYADIEQGISLFMEQGLAAAMTYLNAR